MTAAPVVSKRTAAEEHQRKVSYRNAYLARAAAKRRGLVAEAVSAPSKSLEQRAASDFPSPARSLVKRGLVTDAEEAWSKVKREFERDLEQEEGDVVEDTEEDWSWMDHGESSEGDEEESASEGSLRRRSAELIDEGPVMRMETRMKKASPLM